MKQPVYGPTAMGLRLTGETSRREHLASLCRHFWVPTLVSAFLLLFLVACSGGSGGGGGSASAGLAVTITGLPVGLVADVTVTGPGAYTQHLTANETLAGLDEGEYTVTAGTVVDPAQSGLGRYNGGTLGLEHLQYYPLKHAQKVTLRGSTVEVTVLYPEPAKTVQIPKVGSPGEFVSMAFVLVPAGSFSMGSDVVADNTFVNAQSPHTVTIGEAFYVAKTETTQAQWLAVMGTNPSLDQTDPAQPVEQVSWDMIRASGTGFLAQLNAVPSLAGYGFRLPSEAEWEYSCRAGTTAEYFFHAGTAPLYDGDAVAFAAFTAELDLYAVWGADYTGVTTTSTVASKRPNPWGLYDIIGNVLEWTEDDSHDKDSDAGRLGYTGAPADGSAWVDSPGRGGLRVQRGGSFFNYEDLCRSALRTEQLPTPDSPEKHAGFRLVMPVPALP